jgi:hypothetical protein
MDVPGQEVQQAPSVRVPKRFPLVSRPGFRSTTLKLSDPTVRSPVSDAALLNCYAELDPEDNQYWVEKRLGTKTIATVTGGGGGVGVGFSYSTPASLAVPVAIFGSNLYTWNGSALVNVPYTGGSGHPLVSGRAATFVPIPVFTAVATVVWAVNGSLWQAALTPAIPDYRYANAVDFITSVPWTAPLCDGCVYLDTVLYVMDQQGNIWGSNPNDLTTWLGTTLIKAGGRYDIPVCLAQQLEYVIALKSTSLRCFYNAGAAAQTAGVGSNLAWVEGADSNFGCLSAGTVQLIDNSLLWVTNNDKGTPQVARMDGLQVTIVSTPQVERLLQALNTTVYAEAPSLPSNILYSNGIKRGGHRFYTVTLPPGAVITTPITLVYDLDQQLWYIWSSPQLSYWSLVGVSSNAGVGSGSSGVFAQDITSGAFYLCDIDQVYPTDSGVYCQLDIYTPNADMGTRRKKTLNQMLFVNDQVSGSYMQVRKSDDDYRSWSPFRQVSLSAPQPSLTRCGTFRRRALNIRHYAATPFRIKASDLALDIGTL